MKEILELIENVDPNDTDTLDEIDARVNGFIMGAEFIDFRIGNCKKTVAWYRDIPEITNRENGKILEFEDGVMSIPKFSRSRDALKAIRPEGWFFNIGHNESNSGGLFACSMYSHTNSPLKNSPDLPTEELAELHAIIQAIEWERNND